MVTAVEVRPRIRSNPPIGLPPSAEAHPSVLVTEEVKPRMVKRSAAVAPGSDPLKPKPISATDLRPTIRKSEES